MKYNTVISLKFQYKPSIYTLETIPYDQIPKTNGDKFLLRTTDFLELNQNHMSWTLYEFFFFEKLYTYVYVFNENGAK